MTLAVYSGNFLSPCLQSSETKIFFYQTAMIDGRKGYFFVRAPISLRETLDQIIASGDFPATVAVVAAGEGEPDERTWFNMERYFGFRVHAESLAA